MTTEAVTHDKGETEGKLHYRLNQLKLKGVLLPTLADWSNEVKLVGDAGAHYDLMKDVSTKDAADIVVFVQELLRYLYELPAELSRRKTLNAGKIDG